MVMMKMASPKTNTNTNTFSQDGKPNIPVMNSTTCPTWKLYENPFYMFQQAQDQHESATDQQRQIHRLHLPISSRKMAASFFDLTFMKQAMESEMKKMESLNKRLAREAEEERRAREALERVCQELAQQICAQKAEMEKMRREMEEERKMLRTAEVIREERVQMKLAEAKHFLEDHLQINNNNNKLENPHIRRGIKGFVEFPKVVRAIGCRTTNHFATKLESQKAQLKILLKHKGPLIAR